MALMVVKNWLGHVVHLVMLSGESCFDVARVEEFEELFGFSCGLRVYGRMGHFLGLVGDEVAVMAVRARSPMILRPRRDMRSLCS